MSNTPPSPSMPALARYRPLLGLLTVGLGASIAPMDFAVNVAFPAITAAFALELQAIRWVVICYVLVYASLMLGFGKLGDMVGHRRVFAAGLATAAVAFVLCALAPDYDWLLAARVVQGVAVALVLSCAPALAVSYYAEQRRTWALGAYGASAAVAGILGPLLGGWSISVVGWSGVFWFRAPIAFIALLLFLRLTPAQEPIATARRIGILNPVLLAGGLALVLLSPALWQSALAPAYAFTTALGGVTVLSVFAARDRRAADSIVPHAALRDLGFLLPNLTSIAVHLVGFAIPLLVPYYLARIAGYSAATSGTMLAMSTLGMLAGSMLAPYVVRTFAQRRTVLLGAAIVACAQGWIAFWPAVPAPLTLAGGLLLHGIGLGLFQVAYTDLVVATLPRHDRGVAGSLAMLTRTIGVIVAAVVLSTALHRLEAAQLATGLAPDAAFQAAFRSLFLSTGILLAAFLLLTCLHRRTWSARDA